MPTWLQPCIIVVSVHCMKFGGAMLITGIFSGKMPVAKVVARDSYNANMLEALSRCSKYSLYQVWWWNVSITGILSRKCPVAKVVARDSYNANMVIQPCIIVVSIHCIKFGGERGITMVTC